ncbi:MAG: AAA family ATPase [Bacteroidaceae bacterium]|nr:AAA family ATPase [Bacteroidaceae bacterium]
MDALFERQDALLRATSMTIIRSFMEQVNWSAPMLCIRGPRGVGKSTLLRQYVKSHFAEGSEDVLYCSMDWVYFSQHSMLEVAEKFYKHGGKLLIFDEVHKYENWSREVKEVAETYPQLQLMLSGSSLLKLLDGDVDLSRRCRGYDMPGLSFREYLQFYKGIELPAYSLEEVLGSAKKIAAEVNKVCRPLQHFHEYLKFGYYPFYLTNPLDYYALIEQTVNYVVDVELPQQRKVSPVNCRKIKALLNVLSQLVPYDVDISKLSSSIGLQRNTVIEYLNHLKDAKLLHLLFSDLVSVKKMQKPDKIYLENPNLLYALATTPVKTGTVRECFVVNQLSLAHTVEYGKTQGDFRVDGKWTFEVGGESKSFDQIADIPNSFILADDIESPRSNKLPLWMIGFLY